MHRVYIYNAMLETRAQMSISRRPTLPQLDDLSPHVSLHTPFAPHRLVRLPLWRRLRSCYPLWPRRRSPSQRCTSKRGLSLSSASSSDCLLKFLTAKRISSKDCLLMVCVLKVFSLGGPRYRRLWVVTAPRARLPAACKSILKN